MHLRLFSYFLSFKGRHLWHMEVPGLGVESELQLQPTPQPQQHGILYPLSEARD